MAVDRLRHCDTLCEFGAHIGDGRGQCRQMHFNGGENTAGPPHKHSRIPVVAAGLEKSLCRFQIGFFFELRDRE